MNKKTLLRKLLFSFLTSLNAHCILIFLVVPLYSFSQETKEKKIKIKGENMESFKNLMVKAYFQTPILSLNISDKNKKGAEIVYSPNVKTSIGLEMSYRWFGAGYSLQVKDDPVKDNLMGKTVYQDYQFNITQPRWGMDAYLKNYKGFYLSNPNGLDSNWLSGQNFPRRADLSLTNIGFNVFYIHSDRFSLSAAFSQTERQKKSAGSFLFMWSNNFCILNADSSIIPNMQSANYFGMAEMRHGTFITSTLAPGYGGTIKLKNFFFTPVLFFGAGVQQQDYIDHKQYVTTYLPTLKAATRFAIGYNGDRFLVGFQNINDYSLIIIKNANLSFTAATFKIYIGLRIGHNAPKFWKEALIR